MLPALPRALLLRGLWGQAAGALGCPPRRPPPPLEFPPQPGVALSFASLLRNKLDLSYWSSLSLCSGCWRGKGCSELGELGDPEGVGRQGAGEECPGLAQYRVQLCPSCRRAQPHTGRCSMAALNLQGLVEAAPGSCHPGHPDTAVCTPVLVSVPALPLPAGHTPPSQPPSDATTEFASTPLY